MTELLQTIQTMISSETDDLAQIERTLTDGYAHALELEGDKLRLERRLAEITQRIDRGDASDARELASLAKSIHGKQGALARLRTQLAELRHYADRVRVGRS
jgi:predicted  nucleic acid-binding Zn-ribbon protein